MLGTPPPPLPTTPSAELSFGSTSTPDRLRNLTEPPTVTRTLLPAVIVLVSSTVVSSVYAAEFTVIEKPNGDSTLYSATRSPSSSTICISKLTSTPLRSALERDVTVGAVALYSVHADM